MIQPLLGIYYLEKPVFYCIGLASIGLIVEASQLVITNKIIQLTKLVSSKKSTNRQDPKVITLLYELMGSKSLLNPAIPAFP